VGQTLLSGHSDSLGLLGLNLPDVLATRASAAGGYGSGRPITGKSDSDFGLSISQIFRQQNRPLR
jgi:hypothetical protein